MATTVIGTFNDDKAVQKVMAELHDAGFESGSVAVLEGGKDELIAAITGHGFSQDDAGEYAAAAGRGKKLLAVHTSEQEVERAVAVLERHEAPGQEGREEQQQGSRSSSSGGAQAVREVEEELSIAKRQVGRGGVRVTTHVSEQPVEETVTLREEKVAAKRQAADRVLSSEEADEAFAEKSVELTATGEEVEVRKEARVTGEVVLGKTATEREQTVKDTVRRSEVEVEEIAAKKGRKAG
jgi:uncharacterized protein (TIGR02271 family)